MAGKRGTGGIIAATAVAGAVCLFLASPDLSRHFPADLLGLGFFTVLACSTQFWRIQVPRKETSITVTFGVFFAMLLLYGEAAVPLAVVANIVGMLLPRPRRLPVLIFNAANTALATYLTATALRFGGQVAGVSGSTITYALAPLVCYAINSSLVAAAVAVDTRKPYGQVWRDGFRPLALNYLLLSPLGAVLAYVQRTAGIAGVSVFVIPILMARYSFRLYLDKTREVEEGVKALRRYAERLEQVNGKLNQRVQELTLLQESATAISATPKLRQTLDVVMDTVSRAFGFRFGFAAVFSDDGHSVELDVFHGQTHDMRINKRRCHELALEAAATGKDLSVPLDECVDGQFGGGDAPTDEPLWLMPLIDKGQSVGVLAVTTAPESLKDRLPALNVFRNEAAVAITNARMYERLERMAITDGLTGLYNHRHFLELLEREFRSALRRQAPLSLLVTDIDSFKLVNDTYGHLAGDQLVREVAYEIGAGLRRTDIVARFGGDEFVIILPNTNQAQALEVAEKVRRRVASRDYHIGGSGKIHTTVSVGVAGYPQTAQTRQELVEHADCAAYYSKHSGRNRVSAYSPGMEGEDTMNTLLKGTPSPEGYTAALHNLYVDAIRSLSYLVDAKDPYTYGHSTRVERLATELARECSLDNEDVLTVQRAALLHDIGKVGVSEQILHKRAPLLPDEWEAIKRHPGIGAQIIRGVTFLESVIPLVYHHQERYDGQGYPAGLRGDAIPLGARIIAVADAFEAMTSDRPYRPAKPVGDAVAELKRCAGAQFDPRLVERFVPLLVAEREVRVEKPADSD